MLEGLNESALVGTKQVLKAAAAGRLSRVYLAEDVDAFLSNKLLTVCRENGVEVITVPTMRELGAACNIDVGAACAGLLK